MTTSASSPSTGATLGAPAIHQQVVVVTGGARGLGCSITRAFLREGARVVINYQTSRESAEQIVAAHPGRAIAVQADVRDRAQVDALVATAGEAFSAPVSTVVNNALVDFTFNGDARPKADEIGYDAFAAQFSGAVQGAVNVIQAALPEFDRAGSGRVVNIGTNLFQHPVVPYHDYTAAKAALLSLTRTFAADLGPRRITVNIVSGGLLRTTDASAATPEALGLLWTLTTWRVC